MTHQPNEPAADLAPIEGESVEPLANKAHSGWPWKILDTAVALAVAGMVVVVALQVVSRKVGNSISWTEEVTRILFVYSTFLGMAAGFRRGGHARIAALIARLPRLVRRISVHLYVLCVTFFFLVMGYFGWVLVGTQLARDTVLPSTGLPAALMYAPLVIAAVLSILGTLLAAYGDPGLRRALEDGEMTEL